MAACEGSENGAAKPVTYSAMKPQLTLPAMKADAAVAFYKAAFGAEELKRETHQKRKADQELPLVLCAELKIGESVFVVCDQTDDKATAVKDESSGGIVFRLETDNFDGSIDAAVKAGAVQDGEITEEEGSCCGGKVAKLKDPFGAVWIIASVAKKCAAEPVAAAV